MPFIHSCVAPPPMQARWAALDLWRPKLWLRARTHPPWTSSPWASCSSSCWCACCAVLCCAALGRAVLPCVMPFDVCCVHLHFCAGLLRLRDGPTSQCVCPHSASSQVGRKPFNIRESENLRYALMSLQEAPGLKDPRCVREWAVLAGWAGASGLPPKFIGCPHLLTTVCSQLYPPLIAKHLTAGHATSIT